MPGIIRRFPPIAALIALAACRDESETVVNGRSEPCVDLTSLMPMAAVVPVGDSLRYSLHAVFSGACAGANREIRWEVRDSTIARIGIPTDTSVYVTGLRVGQTLLMARAVADRNSAAASNLSVVPR
jgi:hypothetical protein